MRAGFVVPPCLLNLSDSSAVVRWVTASPESGRVEYGLTSGYGRFVSQSEPSLDHELELTGLGPDTVYHYRVVSGPDSTPDACFRSAVRHGSSFRLLVYGDTHGDSAANQAVVSRMEQVEPRPCLLVHAGDVTAAGQAAQLAAFFRQERNLVSRACFFPAIGNRDADSIANWYRFLALPNNERYYSYRCGSVSFHTLNPYESFGPGTSQYEWLLAELCQDSADPAVRHIVVVLHTPPYTTNTSYAGNSEVRQHLCPLFERFRVAVVFSGHVHAYEHSLVNGVHYVTTGGGGASLSRNWNSAQPYTVYREASYGFVLMDVCGDTLCTRGVRLNGTEFDSLVIVAGTVGTSEGRSADRAAPRLRPAGFGRPVVRLSLSNTDRVSAALFDASGRRLASVPARRLSPGEHVLRWDAARPGSGVCICVVQTKETTMSARFVVAR